MVGSTQLHKVGHTIAIMLINQWCCHGEMAIRGKTDGGGGGEDKEIKDLNLLPCKHYIEFNISGKNDIVYT